MAEGRLSTKTEQEEETEGVCVCVVGSLAWPSRGQGGYFSFSPFRERRGQKKKNTQQLQQLQGYGLLDRPAE